MLRIARTRKSSFLSSDNQDDQHFAQYQQLTKIIKKHLSPVIASVFAQPVLQDNSEDIEWYSDLHGQPEPLLSLSDEQQLKAKKLLSDRLTALNKLADQLPQLEPGSEDLQTLLRKAVQFPGDRSVYVINEQPVITFWGVPDPDAKPARATNSPLPHNPKHTLIDNNSKAGIPRFLFYLGWLLLFALLAVLLWYWFSKQPINWQDYNPFIDEYQMILDKVNAAGDNCLELEQIYTDDPLIHKTEDKFIQLKKQVESRLDICLAYAQLKDEIERAKGDCQKLVSILNQNPYLQNAQDPFIELKRLLKSDVKLCAEYQKLKSQIDSAKDNCPLLTQINANNPYLQQPEGIFFPLKQQLANDIQDCNTYQTLKNTIDQSQLDCKQLKNIASENRYLQKPEGKFLELKQKIIEYQKNCKQKQIENIVNLCPGERPVKLAPELVIVFDASGSMAYPPDIYKTNQIKQKLAQANLGLTITILARGQRAAEQQYANLLRQLSPAHKSRMQGAKTAVNELVKKTPDDMDIGLVVLKDCPSAQKYGFYSPSKRPQFMGLIKKLNPEGGTPLGNAILNAGQMIDGVNKPATMIVISDGEESCKSNPCAIAKKLAAQKPYLTINVVDILGTGAGNCIAKATKNGKVYTAHNMQDIIKMTEEAASTAIPKNCKN